MDRKKTLAVSGIIIVVIITFLIYNNWKPWMLSLYGNGQTIMRIDYPSKDSCLSAGHSYMIDKSAERFDCSYKCSSFDKSNLQASPICKMVCNEAGCRL